MCEMTEKILTSVRDADDHQAKKGKFKAPIAYHFNWDVLDSLTKLW